MPSTPIYPPTTDRASTTNPLPPILHTPLGLTVIEIQGTLNIPTPDVNSDSGRQQIGRLEFPMLGNEGAAAPGDSWMKTVHLYIGERQRLVGEVRKLDKPLGVLRKREGRSEDRLEKGEELEIADVVYWKIWFGSRPEFV